MNITQMRLLNRALVYTIAAIVPLVFWRSVTDSFDLTKGTVLNIFGTFLLAAVIIGTLLDGPQRVARPVWAAVGVLAGASIVTSITSMAPIVSVVGQAQRYTGLATILSGLVVVVSIVLTFTPRHLITLLQVLVATAVLVAFYTLLQESGNDPFEWFSESFGKFVFSTLGNPNTGAAYTAVTLPVVAWAMLRQEHHVSIRVTAGAVFGAALGSLAVFQSFQGPVAAVVTVVYLVAWALLNGRTTGAWLVTGVMSLAIPLMTTRSGGTSQILLLALFFAVVAFAVPYVLRVTLPESLYGRRKQIALGCGVVAVAALAVLSPRIGGFIADEVEGGMNERGDFYRTAVEVFQADPLLGSGLETFGFVFAENRPLDHAVRLEGSRTSSVHSVPLGMFSNGGLVLGLAYLAFVGVSGWGLIRALRRDVRAGSGALLAAGTAWLAYQVQSLVSVEHVALFTLHFVLAGIVLAFGWPNTALATQSAPVRARGRRQPARQVPAVAVGAVGVVALVAVTFVITRPMQAARASYVGLSEIYSTGNASVAIGELEKAIDRAPWEPIYYVQLAEILQNVGQTERAADNAKLAIEKSFYNPGLTPQLAQLIASTGDLDTAIDAVREAARRDPLAPGVQTAAARLITTAGTVRNSGGDVAAAQELYDEAEGLVSGRPVALLDLAEVARDGGDSTASLSFVRAAQLAWDPIQESIDERAAELLSSLGRQSITVGDLEGARARFDEALDLIIGLPSAVDGFAELSRAFADQGNDDEAISLALYALDVGEPSEDGLATLAEVHVTVGGRAAASGDLGMAQYLYERALELVPGLQSALDGLASVAPPAGAEEPAAES